MAAKPTEIKIAFHTSKKPTGLSITRSGSTFTCTWKIADENYGEGQTFQYRVNSGNWTEVNVTKTATSKSFSVNFEAYRPTTGAALGAVSFRVKGKRSSWSSTVEKKKKYVRKDYETFESDWAEKTYTFSVPTVAVLTPGMLFALLITFSSLAAVTIRDFLPALTAARNFTISFVLGSSFKLIL